MTPEQRKTLEDEEQFGEIDKTIECIYCHEKNCVRSSRCIQDVISKNIKRNNRLFLYGTLAVMATETDSKGDIYNARCMTCGSYWDMFNPHAEDNS